MVKFVVKKDGTKEPFDGNKIRKALEATAKDTGLDVKQAGEVVKKVLGAIMLFVKTRDEVATSEIRDKILLELDRVAPVVAVGWRKYEETKKG